MPSRAQLLRGCIELSAGSRYLPPCGGGRFAPSEIGNCRFRHSHWPSRKHPTWHAREPGGGIDIRGNSARPNEPAEPQPERHIMARKLILIVALIGAASSPPFAQYRCNPAEQAAC